MNQDEYNQQQNEHQEYQNWVEQIIKAGNEVKKYGE